jgi:hypothetical protein
VLPFPRLCPNCLEIDQQPIYLREEKKILCIKCDKKYSSCPYCDDPKILLSDENMYFCKSCKNEWKSIINYF